MSHIHEDVIPEMFNGGKSAGMNKRVSKDSRCWNCGEGGHLAADCKKERVWHLCEKPGQHKAQYP